MRRRIFTLISMQNLLKVFFSFSDSFLLIFVNNDPSWEYFLHLNADIFV